jgi:energy-coupling factor transporter ATP-binding protein EcfA2
VAERQVPESGLVGRVEQLEALAQRRMALIEADPSTPSDAPSASARPGPAQRARELLEHTRSYLLPRAHDLDAPLIVVVLGPTGSGKSTLVNTIAGAAVSETGVLRPTTRDAVVIATDVDFSSLRSSGALGSIPSDRLQHRSTGAITGLVLVDAPDIDSVEHDNRALADRLLELADLCMFVTTATRYADRVPWDVLARVEQRGLPLVVVVNRLPVSGDAGRNAGTVLDDVRRLLAQTGLAGPDAGDSIRTIEVVGVPEGAVDLPSHALQRASVGTVLRRLEGLGMDRQARRALAEQALAGAIRGLAPLANAIADDLEHAAIDADALRRVAAADYEDETRRLLEQLERGTVLREEVLRQWHSFVGADQVTRLFAHGIGRVRGAISAVIRGAPPAPVAQVQQGAADDVTALVVAHASDAARRVAAHWSSDRRGAELVATDAGLWSASPGITTRTRAALEDWVRAIAADVGATGAAKKGLARGLSLSVNAMAVTVMLGVFAHTGGVTGAEVGIAAATAFLNQKLLNAVFGEAAVQDLIATARGGLRERVRSVMDAERARFEDLAPDVDEMRSLAGELRTAAVVDGAASPA